MVYAYALKQFRTHSEKYLDPSEIVLKHRHNLYHISTPEKELTQCHVSKKIIPHKKSIFFKQTEVFQLHISSKAFEAVSISAPLLTIVS